MDHQRNSWREWEWIKQKIKDESRAFSGKKKAEQQLKSRLSALQTRIDKGFSDEQEEYDSTRRELKEIELHRANNIILCPRANWALHGERTSSYFLNLEKIKKRTEQSHTWSATLARRSTKHQKYWKSKDVSLTNSTAAKKRVVTYNRSTGSLTGSHTQNRRYR